MVWHFSDGAARYDEKTLTWFFPKNGLGGDTVVSIAEDRQGSIWFGTEGGVSRFDGKNFVSYSNDAGLPETRSYVLWIAKEPFGSESNEVFFVSTKTGFRNLTCLNRCPKVDPGKLSSRRFGA